jgi:hypothetical protein
MSGQEQHVRFDLATSGLSDQAQTLVTTLRGVRAATDLTDFDLEPFGVLIGRVGHKAVSGSAP